MADWRQSIKLLRNKFNRIKDKIVDMNKFTTGF